MIWPTQSMQRDREAARQPRKVPGTGSKASQDSNPLSHMPGRRAWLTFLIILAGNYLVMRLLLPNPEEPITIPYTTFKEQVDKGNVESIYSKGASIEGRFQKPVTWPAPGSKDARAAARQDKGAARWLEQAGPRTANTFTTTLPAFVGPGLESFLIQHNVEISASPIQGSSPWATLLFGFGPALLFILFYVWMYRRASQGGGLGGALMGIGRSKARRYDQESDTRVTFNDVA